MKHILLFSIAWASLALAYDTGHHGDLTRNGLEVLGYNRDAQTMGAVANWMVDYFSYTLSYEEIKELNSMHFDNLFYIANISNYFNNLVGNTRSAIQNLTSGVNATNDPITLLFIIGASLHCVQDFYTHSSWAEHHQNQCGCYRDETWFGELAKANGSIPALSQNLFELRTYSYGDECSDFTRNCLPGQLTHGDYCEGINKDSYVRPFFEASYAHGFAATVEWIHNIERWVLEFSGGSNAILIAAKNFTDTEDNIKDLYKDYDSSIEVSYATETPFEDDGHYKGSGSGSIKRFATAAAEYMKSQSKYKKQYTELKFYEHLTYPKLYDINPSYDPLISYTVGVVQPFYALNMRFKKVKVRTYNVKSDQTLGKPSPYAIVFMDGMEFEEAVQIDYEDLNPHWTTIKFVPYNQSNLIVNYQLWNDHYPKSDSKFDITNDADGNLDFFVDLVTQALTGDVNGTYISSTNTFTTTKGDNSVTIYVVVEEFGDCVITKMPELFCPNEAYTDLKLHAGCKGLTGTDNTEGAANILSISFALILLLALII